MNSNSNLPLSGKTIVFTRAQEQQGEVHDLLQGQGAKVLDMPALVIGPPDEWNALDNALLEIDSFDWIVFSSSNGVRAVEKRLNIQNQTLTKIKSTLKIATVGKKTGASLERIGVVPDFVPPEFVSDSLIENFPVNLVGLKMLIPRVQTGGRTILADAFGEAGVEVVEVAAYESVCPKEIPSETLQALINKEVDAIAFTSGKTAVHTAQLMSEQFGTNWEKYLQGIKLISIGPQTSLSCKKYFNRVDREAVPHDLHGLIKACIDSILQV